MSGVSICQAVCRLSSKGLCLGGRVCRRSGWKCAGGGVGAGAGARRRGRGHPPVSPPTLPEVAPDWLRDRRAQVTFASGAERGRADPRALRRARRGSAGAGQPRSSHPGTTKTQPRPAPAPPSRGPSTPAWTAAPGRYYPDFRRGPSELQPPHRYPCPTPRRAPAPSRTTTF
nr:PREDICTED: neurogranin isoform X2 [Rhinolophus sinicus]